MPKKYSGNWEQKRPTLNRADIYPKNEILKMDELKNCIVITFFVFLTMLISSCERNTQMIMTTDKVDSINIGLSGSWGTATIDWGDGTTVSSKDLWAMSTSFSKKYLDKSARIITIKGSRAYTIQGLSCFNDQITSLDVSKNPQLESLQIISTKLTDIDVSRNSKLTHLVCVSNKLTNLDVNNNSKLRHLSCEDNLLISLDVRNNTKLMFLLLRSNQLSATELNALFETLHSNNFSKFIFIGGNPGAKDCDISIATDKGWEVDVNMDFSLLNTEHPTKQSPP